jgi:hypothetical protein
MIMQCIQTKFLGPTNHRGSRIVATATHGSKITRAYDYALDVENNHKAVANALCLQLDWPTIKAGGATMQGFVWCVSILGA